MYSKKQKLCTSIDPGLTDGAIVLFDPRTERMIDCTPFSLQDELPNPTRKALLTTNEISITVSKMMKRYSTYFDPEKVDHIIVEAQMKPKLRSVQVAFQCYFHGRCTLSSPHAVRKHYGISVSSKNNKMSSNQLYNKRKKLSTDKCAKVMHQEDWSMMFKKISDYWCERSRHPTRKNLTESGVTKKCKKAINDVCEAYLQAACPVNQKKASKIRKRKLKTKTKKSKKSKIKQEPFFEHDEDLEDLEDLEDFEDFEDFEDLEDFEDSDCEEIDVVEVDVSDSDSDTEYVCPSEDDE